MTLLLKQHAYSRDEKHGDFVIIDHLEHGDFVIFSACKPGDFVKKGITWPLSSSFRQNLKIILNLIFLLFSSYFFLYFSYLYDIMVDRFNIEHE